MGLNNRMQQFVERLNDLNRYLLCFPEEHLEQLDQDEIIEILDQAKTMDLEWDEEIVNSNIEIFKLSHKQSVSYFKRLENLEKIRRTNSLNLASLPINDKKRVSGTSSIGKSSKKPKVSRMWYHYCEKNNHNMVDCRAIAKVKQQKRLALKPMLEPERNLWPSFSKKLMQSKGILSIKIMQEVGRGRLNTSFLLKLI
jgi:hypothetical protein